MSFKRALAYAIIFVVFVVTCVFSAFLATKMTNQKKTPPLEAVELSAHNSTIALELPFSVAPDEEFSVDPEIRYYVRSSNAFWGTSDVLTLHVYSVDFRNELLDKNWSPNAENMANVTIISLQKNMLLYNQTHQKRAVTVAGVRAMEVSSAYTLRGERFAQRVLHVPLQHSTWSLKATYHADNNDVHQTVTRVFNSFTLKKN